jgi:hypothetical protein
LITAGPTGLCSAKEADPGREMRGKKKFGGQKKICGQKKRKKWRKSASIRVIAVIHKGHREYFRVFRFFFFI